MLKLFRPCSLVCLFLFVFLFLLLFCSFSLTKTPFWLWLIMHDLYGGTYLGSVQTVWCCLFFCLTMVDHAWLIWLYRSWICSDSVVLFVFLFDYGWSCMTYMVVQILDLFRQCGVVCFPFYCNKCLQYVRKRVSK
jgi:hypothetical protein